MFKRSVRRTSKVHLHKCELSLTNLGVFVKSVTIVNLVRNIFLQDRIIFHVQGEAVKGVRHR